jgi:hypothetical protein
MRWPLRKRRTRCVDCGYFAAWDYLSSPTGEEREVTLPERASMLSGTLESERDFTSPHCFKRAPSFTFPVLPHYQVVGTDVEKLVGVVTAEHSCPLWFKYELGYEPELHRDLEERRRVELRTHLWGIGAALGGAVIGGGLTILATWLLGR